MQYRILGKTGLRVSEIGFGTWGIGGGISGSIAYGSTNDDESMRALQLAYDLGVTFYDTSDFYGFGHSEYLVGKALRKVRKDILVATKGGMLDAKGRQDFSILHLRQSLEKSLKRLQTDYVDLYQLHNPSHSFLKEHPETLEFLIRLVEEGKVCHIGVSVRSPEEIIPLYEQFDFQASQMNFNFTDQRILDKGTLDFCIEKNIGLIGRTPLCFGFLTGKFSSNSSFAFNDHRSFWSKEQLHKWDEARELFLKVCGNDTHSQAQMALRFCLSYPSVSTVIPGMLTREHVKENIMASDLKPFSKNVLSKMQKIYQENTFFLKKDGVELQ